MGYRVLEDVVKEIKEGYNIAVDYNKRKTDTDQTGDPAPPIPWQQLVERVERFNDIALGTMQRGNRDRPRLARGCGERRERPCKDAGERPG